MSRILFLLADAKAAHNDNHQRLPAGFRNAGWEVSCAPHSSLVLANGTLLCAAGPLLEYDRIWPLGFGEQATFFDRMQLLEQIPQDRLVTTVEALLLLHGKFRWQAYMPETFVSNDSGYLLAQTGRSADWVIKPTAGSYGREVYRLRPGIDQQATLAHIEQLTSNGRYAMLQRYLPEIESGEKRVLFAGGLLLGAYLRRPSTAPPETSQQAVVPLANLAAGGTASLTTLAAEETTLAQKVANELLAKGVGFAAIDLVHPYLMEVNIANPGGLGTLAMLTGKDPSAEVVNALVDLWL
ncbi:MAG: RimK family alpha-L-glutamate ligase [Pseudomonadales bacterium]